MNYTNEAEILFQLEQPVKLMSAKNYKEKIVDPLIKKAKAVGTHCL